MSEEADVDYMMVLQRRANEGERWKAAAKRQEQTTFKLAAALQQRRGGLPAKLWNKAPPHDR